MSYVATEPAIAGNPLYLTGIHNYTLVNSPCACHAKVFDTKEAAEAEVAPWNSLGHRFTVRPHEPS